MAEKRPREDDRNSNDERGDGSGERSSRVVRTLGMTEDELAARERRRIRFLAQRQQWEEHGDGKKIGAESEKRKPWESLVVGKLGENLSHIERKDREIEQQKFIVRYHEENSPHQVKHNRRILDRLIEDRMHMKDNKENNMPQDEREKQGRISSRLDLLRWALDSSQCDDEKVNIRAAIQGYESGEILYSCDFTLIYAGHIVDRCPTYNSFCVDRSERLDRYSANYGPGWLWQEPPLAGSGTNVLGKKGMPLERTAGAGTFGVGTLTSGREATKKSRKRDASCRLETLLDSGATFPIIFESDLARLNINLSKYPAQGALALSIVGGRSKLKFYEMYVSVCSDEGESLVGRGKDVVWPEEPRTLGGFCPVLVMPDSGGDRLSGMMPFDACYISSAPSMRRLWLGEDRRDVLGTSRLPAHLRFDSDKKFILQYPEEFEDLRREAGTPDRVLFFHEFPNKPNILLTDSDELGARGKSELAIGHYKTEQSSSGQEQARKAEPHRVLKIEPRKGGVKIIPNDDARSWEKHFTG